jgi:NADPH2:quinone reductase
MTSMLYVFFDSAGGPEVIRIATAEAPRPGPGEVLIEVVAAGVNRPDCMQRLGVYPPPPGESAVPGLEVSGRIAALGADVASLRVGDEVCALLGSGGYADYCVAAAPLCLPVPKALSLIEPAGVPETFFTVYDNVFTRGRLKAGETLLVHGGSSGIGSTAIQLAKAFSAKVIATAGSDEKCAFCRTLGADGAINYRTQDFVAEAKAFTQGRGVDVVLDMVGGSYFVRNLSALALEGRLVQIAAAEGGTIEKFNLWTMLTKRLTLTGSTLRARTIAQKAEIAAALREKVWPLLEAGRVKPVIHATFPLEQARQAHELMESSAHTGKILLVTGK